MKVLIAAGLLPIALLAQQPQGVPENAAKQISPHIWAISGFPNVEIVVGSRSTLAVDTGMGRENGAVVFKEASKLSKNPVLYLTTTHFHPEHAMGEQAFPANTIIVRPAVQQKELEEHGQEFIDMFSSRSPRNKELLAGVRNRKPDITFDREIRLDLGGVTARLMWLGPGHTQGDELIFIEEDSALISGDIVQDKLVPNLPGAASSFKGWLALLDKLTPLQPKYVIPDHGGFGDGSLIAQQKAFMLDVQSRAQALRAQGVPAEEAGKQIQNEFTARYKDWTNLNPLPNLVRRIYAE